MGCYSFLKTVMCIFNSIIFLGGIAILGVGIWVKVDAGTFQKFSTTSPLNLEQLVNVGYLCIALGCFLVVVGFLGCCGAIKESKCMLLLFFIIVLLVFIAEMAGAIVMLAFSSLADTIFGKMKKWAVKTIREDYSKNDDITKMWDTTMTEMKCCGLNNFTDFQNSSSFAQNGTYPKQCCWQQQWPCNATNVNQEIPGCFERLLQFFKDNTKILGAVGLGIAALEVMAMVVSMGLYCHIQTTA
ncbi:tetraspanin-1-like [Latimeria chalumnae]|uniref:tetraspanin-1-like n=1 Tax=Latimeria chalumnae TaxID=7897 RepID=UPI00313E716C